MIDKITFWFGLSALLSGVSNAAVPADFAKFGACTSFVGLSNHTATGWADFYIHADNADSFAAMNVTLVTPEGAVLQPLNMTMGHVHLDTCANNGGAHWKADPSQTTVSNMTNEFHFMLPAPADGVTYRWVETTNPNFAFDNRIKSVVVHNTAGTKVGCCDIVLENPAASPEPSASPEPTAPASSVVPSSIVAMMALAVALAF